MQQGGPRGASGRTRKLSPRSNAARSRRTRRALLDAGRAVLTAQGYARTQLVDIFRRAGVTRGALSYHFPHKPALFAAVFAEVCQEYTHAMQTRMQTAPGDTWARWVASLGVLLDQVGHPSVQQIVYRDGPTVLGWSYVSHQAPDMQFLRSVFAQLQAEGVIAPLPLDPLVHLVRATCFQAAVYIVQAEERAGVRQDMTAGLLQLLAGLRSP